MSTNPSSSSSTGSAQPPTNQPNLTDSDPLAKYLTLLPILKESLTNMIKHTMHILQNNIIGQCRQTEVQMLNKCLEDFYNISDQIHYWLNLADTTVDHYLMGSKFSHDVIPLFNKQPIIQTGENNASNNNLLYSEYLSNSKKQVAATQELRNILIEFADGLGNDE